MATDKDKHLECVLLSHKMTHEEKLLKKHRNRRTDIREFLQKHYSTNIHNPFDSGSYAKNTAVNKKFDFDLVVPFKRDAHNTLKDMYDDIYAVISEEFQEEADVRPQKVSVGLVFHQDDEGHQVNVDVVPGRELNQGQYLDDRKLNLYVRNTFGVFEEGSDRLRTNVNAQIDNIRSRMESGEIRKMIRLMKVWKINHHQPLKSFLIELITIKAFEKEEVQGSVWEKLKMVLEFIEDQIRTISLPDPGNSGNDVSDTLTSIEKSMIVQNIRNLLDRIDEDNEMIKFYFPINEDFPCEEDTQGKYKIREEGVIIPPPVRFG